jgi:hypothetical protein
VLCLTVAYPGNFFGGGLGQEVFRGGGQQIQLREEGRGNGGSGAVAPQVSSSTQFANL